MERRREDSEVSRSGWDELTGRGGVWSGIVEKKRKCGEATKSLRLVEMECALRE